MTGLESKSRASRYRRSRSCRSYRRPSYRQLQEENERSHQTIEELERDGYHSSLLRQNQQTVEMLNSDPVNLAGFVIRRRSDTGTGKLMEILTNLRATFENGQRHLIRLKVFEVLEMAVTDHVDARLVNKDTGA